MGKPAASQPKSAPNSAYRSVRVRNPEFPETHSGGILHLDVRGDIHNGIVDGTNETVEQYLARINNRRRRDDESQDRKIREPLYLL